MAVLKPNGGRVHAFLGPTLPSAGLHAMRPRDPAGITDKDKLDKVLAPQVSAEPVYITRVWTIKNTYLCGIPLVCY